MSLILRFYTITVQNEDRCGLLKVSLNRNDRNSAAETAADEDLSNHAVKRFTL